MRAIDGDILEKKLKDAINMCVSIDTSGLSELKAVLEDVEEMPTIEPRKKGHWIRHPEQRNIFNGKTIECSECHEKYTVQYVEDEWFCRHCGADMREDGEADESD